MEHLVLVYGSLRKGGALNGNMEGAELVGSTRVPGKMYKATSYYPAVVPSEDETVLVEAYKVSDNHLHHLDMVEGHPNFYCRHEVATEFGSGWMYFWTPDMINDHPAVESGDWIKEWKA